MRIRCIAAAVAVALFAWGGIASAADGQQGATKEKAEPKILLVGWAQPLVPPPPPPPPVTAAPEAPAAEESAVQAPVGDGPVQYEQGPAASCCNGGQCCNNNSCCNTSCSNQGCCNDGWLSSCCDCGGGLLDNTVGWVGWDAYKGVADSTPIPPGAQAGYANNSGLVSGLNTGIGLTDSGIHAQVGASYGLYDWLGRDNGPRRRSAEEQVFITAGLFKRSNVCCDDRIAWAVVYDQFFAHNYGILANDVALSQMRGLVGYALNECNEVGVWGAMQLQTDRIAQGNTPIHTANQLNAYWRHNWAFGGDTMAYTGWFDQAGTNTFAFGMMGLAPLNDCVSLYGNFAYVVPVRGAGNVGSNDLIWNVSVGLQIAFGSKARSCTVSGRQGLPLLPVANNGTFLITR